MLGASSHAATFLKVQRVTLTLGAVVDAGLAAALLFAPGPVLDKLQVPPPGEGVYLWLMALLLAALCGVYLLAAYDPMAYAGNVLLAIVSRGAAGAMLVYAGAAAQSLRGLVLLGGVDLAFAAVHGLCWSMTRHLRAQLL